MQGERHGARLAGAEVDALEADEELHGTHDLRLQVVQIDLHDLGGRPCVVVVQRDADVVRAIGGPGVVGGA